MSERKFNIVFDGSVINGSDPSTVKASVQQLFKLDDASADKLFTGKPIVIKKNIDRKTAMQFQNAMTKAGARVQLVIYKQDPADTPTTEATSGADTGQTGNDSQGNSQADSQGGWTLAAAGSALSDKKVEPTVVAVNTDHIQLEQNTRNPFLEKLDASEKQALRESAPTYPNPDVETSAHYDLKSEEQILSENQSRNTEIDQLIEKQQQLHQTDFDVAEAGSDLLMANEKIQFEELDIDLSHLQVDALS